MCPPVCLFVFLFFFYSSVEFVWMVQNEVGFERYWTLKEFGWKSQESWVKQRPPSLESTTWISELLKVFLCNSNATW